jgi:hypothetical protein
MHEPIKTQRNMFLNVFQNKWKIPEIANKPYISGPRNYILLEK